MLPEEACWADYYRPMEARLDELERGRGGGSGAAIVLAEAREEIECFRRHGNCYGYLFIVLQR